MDRQTGKSRGFGFVTFSSPDGPVAARKRNGEDLQGREVRVEFASDAPGGGGRGRGGGGGGGGDRPYESRGGG